MSSEWKLAMRRDKNKRASARAGAAAVCAGLCVMMAGCLPGPKYRAPSAPASTAPAYKESTVHFTDAPGWKVAAPQDAMLRGKWWEIFQEPELNSLEDQLNINNQNIKVSFENYMAARALIREARAQYWPTVTTSPSWSRANRREQSRGTLTYREYRERKPRNGVSRSMFHGRRTFSARFATRCARQSTVPR